jgi:hypothetical protein
VNTTRVSVRARAEAGNVIAVVRFETPPASTNEVLHHVQIFRTKVESTIAEARETLAKTAGQMDPSALGLSREDLVAAVEKASGLFTEGEPVVKGNVIEVTVRTPLPVFRALLDVLTHAEK